MLRRTEADLIDELARAISHRIADFVRRNPLPGHAVIEALTKNLDTVQLLVADRDTEAPDPAPGRGGEA